jgi:dipeptidase
VEAYLPISNQTEFKPIGYIPQVGETFAYFEETYGIMNEKQVATAESTCSSMYSSSPVGSGGQALLSIDALSQIAMERATNARDAIQIIGGLAEKYGFYGSSHSMEGAGESLMIADPKEGWVFQILADPTGTSAMWAAQRVPDDQVTVVANMFTIREVYLNDTDNYMASKTLYSIAEQQGLIKPGEILDFTKHLSDGEYGHLYYSGRRMWRAFTLIAPSQAAFLPANYTNLKPKAVYPFSIKPDKLLTVTDVFAIFRDYLRGTGKHSWSLIGHSSIILFVLHLYLDHQIDVMDDNSN